MNKLLWLLALAGMMSCVRVSPDDFTIRGVELENVSSSSLTLSVEVESRSRHRVELLDGTLEVLYRDTKFATLLLQEPVAVPAHFRGAVEVPLRIRLSNPLSLLLLPSDDPEQMLRQALVSGEARLRVGGMTRRVRLKDYPLVNLFSES